MELGQIDGVYLENAKGVLLDGVSIAFAKPFDKKSWSMRCVNGAGGDGKGGATLQRVTCANSSSSDGL